MGGGTSLATVARGLAAAALGLAAACSGGGGRERPPEPRGSAAVHAPLCPELPSPSRIAIPEGERKYDEEHEFFDLPDVPELWSAAPEDDAGARYRKAIAVRVGDVSPRVLLERQRAVINSAERPNEAANIDPVLDGRAGVIGEPSCVERRLFARQAARYAMVEHPTEFGAFLLRGNGRAHLYFSSMDMVGQKIRRQVTERVTDDVAHGFVFVAHLHNHPFLLDRKVGDRMWTTPGTVADVAGALAPSLADAGLWQSAAGQMSMRAGWITNGFASSHIPATAFGLFSTHPQ
jgi:hypothetical protein